MIAEQVDSAGIRLAGESPLRVEEYIALRTELLQRYSEQGKLAFASTLAAAAFFFQAVSSKTHFAEAVLASILLQIILTIIGSRLCWNYAHIYRIGSYIMYIHEGSAIERHPLDVDGVWWITASRQIMGAGGKGPWGRHASSEAWLLLVLGIFCPAAALLLSNSENVQISSTTTVEHQFIPVLGVISLGISTAVLVRQFVSLSRSSQNPNSFVESLKAYRQRTKAEP